MRLGRALRARRRAPRARHVSMDRGNARVRGIPQPVPAKHPRLVSRDQPRAAPRRPWPSIAEPHLPEKAWTGRLQCLLEKSELLLPLAGTGVRFLANPPEMSRKAVAQEVP